jgi:hypothetical protein
MYILMPKGKCNSLVLWKIIIGYLHHAIVLSKFFFHLFFFRFCSYTIFLANVKQWQKLIRHIIKRNLSFAKGATFWEKLLKLIGQIRLFWVSLKNSPLTGLYIHKPYPSVQKSNNLFTACNCSFVKTRNNQRMNPPWTVGSFFFGSFGKPTNPFDNIQKPRLFGIY